MSTLCSPEQEKTEAKLAALTEIESSETFSRNEQLRAFLRYVCECEASGRGDQLHEYLIGVEVFGQRAGYSTTDNAIVRNRAHSLRRKLAEYYATEGQYSRLRIEIPKGAYCPRFIEVASAVSDGNVSQPEPPRSIGKSLSLPSNVASHIRIAGLCLILGFTLLAAGFRWGQSRATAVDPVLAEAWGPLLGHSAHTVISIANAPELLVRSLPDDHSHFKRLPDGLDLKTWYTERYPMGPTDNLYITPNHNSPLWGDAASAITTARLLARAGVDMEVLPERVQSPFALRGRNAVVIGRPENSPASALFLRPLFYNIRYSPENGDQEVFTTDAATGRQAALRRTKDRVHGLISVMHNRSADGEVTQIVIFSGVNSAGAIAAAEFFCSAQHMREFRERLRKDGNAGFPDAYQIVVSTEESNYLPFNYFMEAYKALAR